MPKQKPSSSSMLPGMEAFLDEEEEFFFEGKKADRYFDAASLPDAPNYQANAAGSATYTLYIVFPDQDGLVRAITALTKGNRKGLKPDAKIATLNGIAVMKNGLTLLEIWEQDILGIQQKQEEIDPDEAQAPI